MAALEAETMTDPPAETDKIEPLPRSGPGEPGQPGDTLAEERHGLDAELQSLEIVEPSDRPGSLGRLGSTTCRTGWPS
jgi:hypothetical protein